MNLEQELCKAGKVIRRDNEDRQKFLKRLTKVISSVEPDVWEGLSEPAQIWYNESAAIIKDGGKVLPEFPDFPGTGDTEEAEVEEPEVKKPAAKKAVNSEKKPAVATKPEKKPTMSRTLRQIVVKDPSISVNDLIEKLKAKGFSATDVTVATFRSDIRETLKVLVDEGMLNIQL